MVRSENLGLLKSLRTHCVSLLSNGSRMCSISYASIPPFIGSAMLEGFFGLTLHSVWNVVVKFASRA